MSLAALAVCVLVGLEKPVTAQTVSNAEGLSPGLANIKATHTVRIGYRESSPPFSFLDRSGAPIGYSLDICNSIVGDIGAAVDDPDLRVQYVKVTSDSRIPAVVQGQVDLECGSTTANAERSKQVAFSPMIYVSGTKLMVPQNSPINSAKDLAGKTIIVTKGTTNEQALHTLDSRLNLALKFVVGDDHEQSYGLLASGKGDAFATDDILLYGLIARHQSQGRFRVTGDYLSYDPYGIMFRRDDPQLAKIVTRSLSNLATNHDLVPLYNKWFMARLPTGERLDVSMSPQLEEFFRVMDQSQGTSN